MRRYLFLLSWILASAAGCTSRVEPAASPAPVHTQPPTATEPLPTPTTPSPSLTPPPTATPRASRTPRPSPTVPEGDDFACLPLDAPRQSAVVAGVVDGDTIRVQIGPQSFTVRYIGIDTPETNVQPPEPFGPEATKRNRELVSGTRVTLISDPGVGDTDRFNRLLRYVVRGEIFINAALIREGFGRYYTSPGAACGSLMLAAETKARSAHAGLWGP